jgi:hypothetical protein
VIEPLDKRLPNRKYARELLRRLPAGYRIAFGCERRDDSPRRARLWRCPFLFDPQGQVVRAQDGRPLTVHMTPGDRRASANQLASFRRAGVPVR